MAEWDHTLIEWMGGEGLILECESILHSHLQISTEYKILSNNDPAPYFESITHFLARSKMIRVWSKMEMMMMR